MQGTFRSAAFRFALTMALLVAVGAVALLVAVGRQVDHYAGEASRGMLQAESTVLAGEYAQLGLSGLTDALARHRGAGDDPPYRYLLLDAAGRRLFGDLPARADLAGWGRIDVVEREADGTAEVTLATLGTRLPDGLRLVVATDSFDVVDLRGRLGTFTLLSGVCIALLAMLGGYVVGNRFVRRLAEVNRAVDRIIDGDSDERLPMIGLGPEFDDLARNLNRMLDRNAAAMQALRQVSTDIAHDLRTPLTRLHGRLEALRDAGAAGRDELENALTQTGGLLDTFQARLRIGAVEGGVGRSRFAPVALTELMDRLHQTYEPVAEDGGHVLRAEHDRDVAITGDCGLLTQMLTNLIENALVHTPPGTAITSSLVRHTGAVVVEVRDDGPGIPPSERTAVFRRFHRLDASRSTPGAGLGLALVAAIASLHRADCGIVDSETGLTVRIAFEPQAGAADA